MGPVSMSTDTIKSTVDRLVDDWATTQGITPEEVRITALTIEDGNVTRLQVARLRIDTII